MKLEDAPPAGWYPDPERRGRLRWWEGTDWTDHGRVPPSTAEADRALATARAVEPPTPSIPRPSRVPMRAVESEELVAQVREAAREEAGRAADLFSRRARIAVEQGRSMAGEYASMVLRWMRIALVVAATLVIAWFVLQFIAQVTFLDWIGDRIDSISSS